MNEYILPINIKLETNSELILINDEIVLQNDIYIDLENNPTLLTKENLETLIDKQIKYNTIAGEGKEIKIEDKKELELYLEKIQEVINKAKNNLNNLVIKKSP